MKARLHIRKNDLVQIISGREKGKTGKVMKVLINEGKIVIEKMNRVKKHSKPTQKDPKGGIVEIEKPIASSNVLLVCLKCNKASRTASKEMKGKWVRVCRKCGEAIDKYKE